MRWEYKMLDELGSISRGRSKHRPRNDETLFGGKFPFVQTADVKKANLYLTEYEGTYNEKGLEQSKLWKAGTLCITIAANIADTAILGIDACFPDSVVGFVGYENIIKSEYVYYFLEATKLKISAYAPATGTPEVGGYTSLEGIEFIRSLKGLNFVGMDIVEVAPPYDHAEITSLLAANLVFEFLSIIAINKKDQTEKG